MLGTSTAEVVYHYIEDIDPNLTCAICQSALVDPVTTTSCKHTFCRDCITTALSHQPQCPIDRSALTKHNLHDTEMLVKLMLDELKVECAAEGCGRVMERGLLLSHAKGCLKSLVWCNEPECGLSMTRERLPHHRAYECFQRRMGCAKCKVTLTFRQRADHQHDGEPDEARSCVHCGNYLGAEDTDLRLHRWTCARAPVPCPHGPRGCSVICPREEQAAHIASCPFEALGAFFEINDARLQKLEEKNTVMASTIDSLNTEVGILKAELATTRASFPFRRSSPRDPYVAFGSPRSTFPGSRPAPSVRESVSEETVDPNAPSSGRAPSATGSATVPTERGAPPSDRGNAPLSSPSIDARTPPQIPPAQRRGPLGSGASIHRPERRRWYAAEVFDMLPSSLSPEETLGALRSVAVHLGVCLDSVDIGAQLRTMTETLRIQEEVASLRAIVNTLRMQVMIDRPHSFRRPMPRPRTPAPDDTQADLRLEPPHPHTPFASYMSRDWLHPGTDGRHAASDDENSEAEGEVGARRHRVRESVVFSQSVNWTSTSSTSSLVSTGGRVIGRPMGIPPPPPTDFSRVAAMSRTPMSPRSRNPISALGRRLTSRGNDSESRL